MDNGFISLHRKLLNWEWYTDVNVKTLFIHCLLRANFKDRNHKGIPLKRGQFITSLRKLSIETGLSERQVRTALDKLKMTNELTNDSNNQYRIITVLKYNEYQKIDKQDDKEVTNERQASDKQTTTDNNIYNVNKDNKKQVNKRFVKPTFEQVNSYCLERKNNVDAQRFIYYYESNGWRVGKNPMKDWKASIRTWERSSNKTTHKHDYSDFKDL